MKIIRTLYHFLGGLYCALILLALSALFVIAGTLLESWSDSHALAEKYTYGHPLFKFFLWGFFFNILFAATRRWPFKKKHIPFLITHCGLLMILGGVLIKSSYGLQGNLLLLEGSSNNRVTIADSFALHIESRDRDEILPINHDGKIGKSTQFPGLDIALIGKIPHCCERLQTFIKDDQLHIDGYPLMPLQHISQSGEETPPQIVGRINHSTDMWNLYAMRSNDPASIARNIFVNTTRVLLTLTSTGEPLYAGLLKDILNQSLTLENETLQLNLAFAWSPLNGFNKPALQLQIIKGHSSEITDVPLCGTDCLRMVRKSGPSEGAPKISIDLMSDPALIFIEDLWGDIHLVGFNTHGQVHSESFAKDNLKNLYSYNHGFGGYAVLANMPFTSYPSSRRDREAALLAYLTKQLQLSSREPNSLAPPLQWFYVCCKKMHVDFPSHFLSFLYEWYQAGTKLYPLDRPLPPSLSVLFQKDTTYGMWPEMAAHKLSEELLLHQIHLTSIWMSVEEEEMQNYLKDYHTLTETNPLLLETSIKPNRMESSAPMKFEDRVPLLRLVLKENKIKEQLELAYDKTGQGWKWPGLFGKYLVRFQPHSVEIPYEVRLRTATQVSYPQTQQAYSYECRLVIKDCKSGMETEKIISMNNVHETWDGFRFYLAGISPTDEQTVKRAHIVVNYDPAKYWMTYPGALLLSLGIILLFWLKPYSSKKK